MTMATEPQSFEEAVSRFEVFLKENGYSASLIWVEPSDLIPSGQHSIYVKLPVQTTNLTRACDRFKRGISDGLGITFGTICDLSSATCCYAWVPKDQIDQQDHLMGRGLKITARTGSSRLNGILVGSQLRWWLLKLRYRRQSRLRETLFG
jgi:hypothetical protein